MDNPVLHRKDATHAMLDTGGRTMKKIDCKPTERNLGLLCVLMASLLLASAVASADVVLDWNAIAVDTVVANKQNPFAQARYGAIVQVAVFEAVNAITATTNHILGP
jgi:hypothetical protein